MKTNHSILVILLSIGIVLTGCWDLTEIEEIGFVLAVGIDPVDDEDEMVKKYEAEKGRSIGKKTDHDQFVKTSFQVAIPSKIEAQEGARTGRAFLTISSTAPTNFETNRHIASRRSRRLNFEHLKAIVINEEIVRQPEMLEHMLDFFIRDHEMRRRTYMYVTDGDGKEVLDIKLPLEELGATSITDITDNEDAVLQMLPPLTIGELSELIASDQSFLIPRVAQHNDDLKIAGAAVVSGADKRLVGWLGEEDVKGYNWITGEAESSIIQVLHSDIEPFVYEVTSMSSTIDYKRENNKNTFDVEIRVEGAFTESWIHDLEVGDPGVLRQLEDEIAAEIRRQVEETIEKMQTEFHADVFDFLKEVRKTNYDYWKTVKDEWDGEDGEFKDTEVSVDAKVKIRHYMLKERLG
ncbi:Ger(x)C family spore germination protein [Desertibacillus haloalkaliphilus]|uniref:Ger(x)C family spore germination protein n=1 Tax=Desertibacillus haloalkaliphilus TaxID=1328930 RepID=UPI001C25AC6A|nr:Ger(x)C family spore germination protein [Desertibacillus haloalkaliphilus]MBU8905469.1 Ger(x)C family spore germination protein [Desertibacillus haloalkaliphilus]